MRLFLIATVLAAATTATAQTPTAEPRSPEARAEARERILAADADSDGKWSREEWLAGGRRERGFEMMDANKDGFVTQGELRTGMQKLMKRSSLQ